MTEPNVRVRLIGAPTDVNCSFLRGPAAAPNEIRKILGSDVGNSAAENGWEIGNEIDVKFLKAPKATTTTPDTVESEVA